MALGRGGGAPKAPPPQIKFDTKQLRAFKGLNLTDARVAIEDDELFWLENALTVGRGAIQILPRHGEALTLSGGPLAGTVVAMWGFVVTLAGVPTPLLYCLCSNGALDQVNPATGAVTHVASAGTLTASAQLTIWRDQEVLVVDPTKGYRKWNGTTLTLIDATKLGCALAVFQGRVWIAAPNSRTLIFTAPATNNDFTSGNGAGSTVITDEAFPGIIVALASALEQLWVLGEGGIEAVSNVQASGTAPSIVTTFSITNVVAGLGTSEPGSQVGYFRALTFMAPYGVYALSGVTPQKLSDKLDGLFPGLTLGHAYVAVVVVQTLPVLMFLVQYTPTAVPGLPTPGSNSLAVAPLLLCFTQGKWFTASQGAPVAITSLLVDGVAQGWASRGTDVYRLFGADLETPVVYKVQSKLYDFGASTTRTQMMRFGFEYQAESIIAPDFTIDSEAGQEAVDVVGMGNALTLINDGGDTLTLVNDVFAVLTFIVSTGMILSRTRSNSYGRYLGFTLRGEDPPYRAQAFQMQTALAAEWDTP